MSRVLAISLLLGSSVCGQIQRAPAGQSFLAMMVSDEKLDRMLDGYPKPDYVVRLNLALPDLSSDGWNKFARFKSLTRIDISRAFDLDDKQLRFLEESQNLRMLTVARCDRITGSVLSMARRWPSLSRVVIQSKSFDGENLKHLRGKPIQSLKVSSPLIRPRHLTALGGPSSLRELEVSGSPKLFALDLSQFPNLERLTIRDCGLRRMVGLKDHKHLAHVFLLDCEHLKGVIFDGADSLQTIEVTNAEVGNRTAESASKLPRLRRLSLSGCLQVTSLDLQRLGTLENLDLANTGLSRGGLQSIRAVRQLRRLDLSQCSSLTDNLIAAAIRLPRLKTIDVSGTDFSDEAYKMLEEMQERPDTRVYMKRR